MRISVKERKQKKKERKQKESGQGISSDVDEDDGDELETGGLSELAEEETTKKGRDSSKSQIPKEIADPSSRMKDVLPLVVAKKRGRRGKLKKMRQKYGDQDEEDRRIMLDFLGSKEVGEIEEVLVEARGEDEFGEDGNEEDEEKRIALELKRLDAEQRELEYRERLKAEEKERMTTMQDPEESAEIVEEELEKLSELDTLTGQPRAEDSLLFAVPVCGPYAAMHKYKFKCKVAPGTMKKGKSVGAAVSSIFQTESMTQGEKELLRGCSHDEMVHVMISNAKVQQSGSSSSSKGRKRKK
jgi:hypothetical protein